MSATKEVIAADLWVPEGPAVGPDGTVYFTEQTKGRVSVLTASGAEEYAYTGGAANSCVVGRDGDIYVCQNGGVVDSWRSSDPRPPGIQRVDAAGVVTTIRTEVGGTTLAAPNDLAFSPTGGLYFTDPAQAFDLGNPLQTGALYRVGAGSEDIVHYVGGVYCNGLAFDNVGNLFWVESYTRRLLALTAHGEASVLCTLPEGHTPDGFAIAEDGRFFIATCGSGAIDVVAPDGELLTSIILDDIANPSNCAFDGSTLIITDFSRDYAQKDGSGRLWRLETDAIGVTQTYGFVN